MLDSLPAIPKWFPLHFPGIFPFNFHLCHPSSLPRYLIIITIIISSPCSSGNLELINIYPLRMSLKRGKKETFLLLLPGNYFSKAYSFQTLLLSTERNGKEREARTKMGESPLKKVPRSKINSTVTQLTQLCILEFNLRSKPRPTRGEKALS